MRRASSSFRSRQQQPGRLRGGLAVALCSSLLLPGIAIAAPPTTHRAPSTHPAPSPLTPQQKALHALDRFTFGPRPGDLAQVEHMGLEAWFQQQLHPTQLPDTDLDRRLAQFPAMQLSQAELVAHFPTPNMLRQYSRGQLAMPDDAVDRAIYADASLSYEERREKKKEKGADAIAAKAQPMTVAAPAGNLSSPHPIDDGSSAQLPDWSPAALNSLLNLPPAQRLQRLLALPPEQMLSLRQSLKRPGEERLLAGLTPAEVEQVEAMRAPERAIAGEVLSTRLLRDVYSNRQLEAVMTDFWLNHFSVYRRKNQTEMYLLPAYEREAIRPNALGHFEDLLVATAKSPAMLVYLDNWESVGPDSRAAQRNAAKAAPGGAAVPAVGKAKAPRGINENYARELMELHTLGVNGGYTQADVIEVAKCFTGWTIDRPAQGGEYQFNPSRHEPGTKTVLGQTIPEGGEAEGLAVLHLLATSPATAHLLSLELAQRFVSDTPPPALVDRMAATYLKTDGDIRAVLTTLFHAPEFWAPAVLQAKVKTPLEFVTSALRASNAEVSQPLPLVEAMDRLGMPVYGMQTPNGYSWQADAWVSSNALLTRMNFALVLSGNRLSGTSLNWPQLLGDVADPSAVPDEAVEARLETTLLGHPAAPQTHVAALREAGDPDLPQQAEQSFQATPSSMAAGASPDGNGGKLLRVKANRSRLPAPGAETPLATLAGLLLGSPDFQRH